MTTIEIGPVATIVPFASYSVGCIKLHGRMVGREFADLASAEAFFNGAVFSGNYASVFLYGYTADGDCVDLDECTDCYGK